MVNIHAKAAIGCEYQFLIHDEHGNLKLETDWTHNLFTDWGLDDLYTSGTYFNGTHSVTANLIGLSDETAEPQVTDRYLGGTYIHDYGTSVPHGVSSGSASWSEAINYYDKEVPYVSAVRSVQFNQGQAKGTWSTVASGRVTNTTTGEFSCSSKARIKDPDGNPTTITVADNEFLTVRTRFNMYFSRQVMKQQFRVRDENGNIRSTHTLALRYHLNNSLVYSSAGISRPAHNNYLTLRQNYRWGATRPENASGSSLGSSSTSDWVNVTTPNASDPPIPTAGRGKRVKTTFGINSGNGNIDGFDVSLLVGTWQGLIDPPIKKDNTQEITFSFMITWDRVDPNMNNPTYVAPAPREIPVVDERVTASMRMNNVIQS